MGVVAGCGDIIRNDSGNWVACYDMHIGFYFTFTVELWGVLRDIQLA